MKALVQRIVNGEVISEGIKTGEAEDGLLVYLGIHRDDSERDKDYIIRKIAGLRIFSDNQNKMNLSLLDLCTPRVLLISQFTLISNTKKGNRPFFGDAADPEKAEKYYDQVRKGLETRGIEVDTGRFRTHMRVTSTNVGPVSIILDSFD